MTEEIKLRIELTELLKNVEKRKQAVEKAKRTRAEHMEAQRKRWNAELKNREIMEAALMDIIADQTLSSKDRLQAFQLLMAIKESIS